MGIQLDLLPFETHELIKSVKVSITSHVLARYKRCLHPVAATRSLYAIESAFERRPYETT